MRAACRRLSSGLVLIGAVLAAVVACRTTEGPHYEYMPNYRITYPSDLPTSETRTRWKGNGRDKGPSSDAPAEEFEDYVVTRKKLREEYAEEHVHGWRECFFLYRWGKTDLAQSYEDRHSISAPPESLDLRLRGRRDGYEECRRMLIENGNK